MQCHWSVNAMHSNEENATTATLGPCRNVNMFNKVIIDECSAFVFYLSFIVFVFDLSSQGIKYFLLHILCIYIYLYIYSFIYLLYSYFTYLGIYIGITKYKFQRKEKINKPIYLSNPCRESDVKRQAKAIRGSSLSGNGPTRTEVRMNQHPFPLLTTQPSREI